MEASGTGNMKLALNGALTIGTLDGANIEIKDRVGAANIFIFGLTADEVERARREPHASGRALAARVPHLGRALELVASGAFSPDDPGRFRPLVHDLLEHDHFLVTTDFAAYWEAQRKVDAAFAERDAWLRSGVLNTARMGFFSSDRTIRGYARDIWHALPPEVVPEPLARVATG
jgi:starch phosphorylase